MSEMNLLPKGLWPVMLTPLRDDNTIDVDGVKMLTEFYIETGAAGLFANCLSSEMFQLTGEERLLLTKTVVDCAAGRLPVVATGSFGTNMKATAEFTRRLYDTGTAAVVVSTSQPCGELDDEDCLERQLDSLLAQTEGIPLGLYECPVPYKRLLSPDLLGRLARTNRFLYHKDTACDLLTIRKKIAATAGTPLMIYNAHVPTGVASIRAGARGLSPIAANLYPELFTYLLHAIEDGREGTQIDKLTNDLDILDTIIHHNYPYTAKLFLQRRGLAISTASRIPRSPMTAHDLGKVDTVMSRFDALCQELGIRVGQRTK